MASARQGCLRSERESNSVPPRELLYRWLIAPASGRRRHTARASSQARNARLEVLTHADRSPPRGDFTQVSLRQSQSQSQSHSRFTRPMGQKLSPQSQYEVVPPPGTDWHSLAGFVSGSPCSLGSPPAVRGAREQGPNPGVGRARAWVKSDPGRHHALTRIVNKPNLSDRRESSRI